ncbi:hypothetical protein CBP51_05095 [Cellvibrio mixtus]|uniref:Glycosyl transferase family 1 n=1 Tax=Cellvibrio mixtus TaxID=39650 RepID=A0A266Q9V8_9GAMM|nr:glycosyltransferase family 4 protein [Cellvibrio mixtus]OZY86406.1 hypothetical protein CBP51_05095 [Cellvibrio mixtus]
MEMKFKKNNAVCVVTYKYLPEWGGLARSASRLVEYLLAAGYEVHVIVPSFSAPENGKSSLEFHNLLDKPELDARGAHVYRPQITHKENLMGELLELLLLLDQRHDFRIFHGYYLPFSFPCLMVASSGNRPVIASIRGSDAVKEGVSPFYFPYIQAALQQATWITSVSSDLLKNANGITDISKKSSVIFNGIDTTGFPRWKGYEATQGIVGTMGELRFKKAIPLLVKAYSNLEKSDRKKLILGGVYADELEKAAVHSLIQQCELQDEVVHTGFLKRNYLLEEATNFNIFVVNSYHDGMPNTLLEAAACGIPIIATRVGGMIDVLEDGVNALLVDPGDANQLSAAISKLLQNKTLCSKLSKGALRLAAKLNYQQENDSWITLYKKLLCETYLSTDKSKSEIATESLNMI